MLGLKWSEKVVWIKPSGKASLKEVLGAEAWIMERSRSCEDGGRVFSAERRESVSVSR